MLVYKKRLLVPGCSFGSIIKNYNKKKFSVKFSTHTDKVNSGFGHIFLVALVFMFFSRLHKRRSDQQIAISPRPQALKTYLI